MATKHLYILEDVAATLLYALEKGDRECATKCVAELLSSKEQALAESLLVFACILREPGTIPYGALANRDIPTLLASFRGPNPLPAHEEVTPVKPPKTTEKTENEDTESWKIWPQTWTKSQAAQLWNAVQVALKARYWQKAYRLLAPLMQTDKASIKALLEAIQADLTDLLETEDLPFANRVLKHSLCAFKVPKDYSKQTIFESKGRTFSILSEALARWHILSKPVQDLQGCPILVKDKNASNYWKEIVQHYQITGKQTLVFQTDDDLEEFYCRHFPNDIPDEWSTKERLKSHGIETKPHSENPWLPVYASLLYKRSNP